MSERLDWTEVEFDQHVNAIERALYADMWLTKILSEVLAEVARQDAGGETVAAMLAKSADKQYDLAVRRAALAIREALRISTEDKP